jgi:riboflavin biosynthesis pyrimidine reductase
MRRLLPLTGPDHIADLIDEAAGLAAHYAVPAGRHVRLNFVASADGAAEIGDLSGPLGSPADKAVFRTLRSLADVVLVGAGTARAENYGPVLLAGREPASRPPLAVVTRSANIAPDARFLTAAEGPRPIIITCAAATISDALRDQAEIILSGDDTVDLPAAITALAARGLPGVLCEGGPALFGDLGAAGLVDELCLTVSPLLAGPQPRRIIDGPRWDHIRALELSGILEQDGTLLLRYEVKNKAPTPSQ